MAKAVDEQYLGLIKRLVDRLERLSADSTYAHRASGVRGSLLQYVEFIEASGTVDIIELDELVEAGFKLLKAAAQEIGGAK